LNSEDAAVDLTKKLVNKYNELGVSVLIESAVNTEKDESYYWRIFDKEKFEREIKEEKELNEIKRRLMDEERRVETNSIRNTTAYSKDEYKLKMYENLYEEYYYERPLSEFGNKHF